MPLSYAGRQPKSGVAQVWLQGRKTSPVPISIPFPFWFVSNINWRQYAVRCHQLNNIPYPKMVPIPTCFYHAAPSQPVSLLMLSSQTFPHRAQGKISTQAVRSERSGKVGVGGFKPGSHCQRSSGGLLLHLLCLVRRPRVL